MRLHLLGLPNAPASPDAYLCGFAQMTCRFAKLLNGMGHDVVFYGAEGSTAVCNEFHTIISDQERREMLAGTEYQACPFSSNHPAYKASNYRISHHLRNVRDPKEFVLVLGGNAQEPAVSANPYLTVIEYSIGYPGSFAPYRVFETPTWQHWTYGRIALPVGRFFDGVIFPWVDAGEYPFIENGEGYLLYCGRLTPEKGITTACQIAERAGMPLKVVGHGDRRLVTYGEYLGPVNEQEKRMLMAHATALLSPVSYIEPCGIAAIEAQMCGTPVIGPSFGGYVDTIEPGKTGWCCHYMQEFVDACRNARFLRRTGIRERAENKFGVLRAAISYAHFFQRMEQLWEGGFYSKNRLRSSAGMLK